MNKIEQMHLDTMIVKDLQSAVRSAEITEQIAIEFSEWQQRLLFSENSDWLIDKTTKELFQEFLKTKTNVV
jgi:hypothetical protein